MPFHINATAEQISRYVFCPGSQSRAGRIADHFDERQLIADDRGIVVYSGYYKGIFMTACGTGMGGPATAIALEELAQLGADTFIRAGSCGALQPDQQAGDIVIATGSYRTGGTSVEYLPMAFPAVPSFVVLQALVRAAEGLEAPVSTGVGLSLDAFYGMRNEETIDLVRRAGGRFVEMESDAVFILGHARGWRTGALFTADGAADEIKAEAGREAYQRGEARMIEIALQAMASLAQSDADRQQ